VKSFSILRTNPGLTTNMKIVVDSDYNLFLESIDSTSELTYSRFKRKAFNKASYFEDLIPYFFKNTPSNIAFFIKNDDVNSMSNDFSFQYDEIYQMGARNITNNKSYVEEYEYFAPLYVKQNKLPQAFIIFRVDGPGVIELNKDNFKSEILERFKTVKFFDMTDKSPLGEWLNLNFNDNQFIPNSPLDLDFRNLEFTKWNGIDYETGGYTSKSLFIDTIIEKEKEIFELEKFVFDGFRRNKIVFPNILNLNFLFDDSPSTPDFKRKWSLNRYYGFYVDFMDKVMSVTPYKLPKLKSNVIIHPGNIISTDSNPDEFKIVDDVPFETGWIDDKEYYIEYNGVFYKVEKFTEESPSSIMPIVTRNQSRILKNKVISDELSTVTINRYKIISDIDLQGKENELNKNLIFIDIDNVIKRYDNQVFEISNFELADIWLIEIDGIYHNIIKEGNNYKLFTDYAFLFKEDSFEYWTNKEDISLTKNISLVVDVENQPKKFNVFKLNLSDIKDFDTKIIDTEYSKYEYEKEKEITQTDETKMYMEDIQSETIPRNITSYIYNNKFVNIPVSSEYTANYETFKISDKKLSDIWNVNPVYCRWVFSSSLSGNDYPYLMNNSELFEDFNRTVNPFDPDPKRIERNLDYFYTINSSTSSYTHHTLHIENHLINGSLDVNFKFELNKYINEDYKYDYFSELFDKKTMFDSGKIIKNTKKYSLFNKGDKSIPNLTLFRGIKFFIYNVQDIKLKQDRSIESFNLYNDNSFEDYKFSILLSKNDKKIDIDNDGSLNSITVDNQMEWKIIEEWQLGKSYNIGDIVINNDILYISKTDNIIEFPEITINNQQTKNYPGNNINWGFYHESQLSPNTVFWNPIKNYFNGDYVFNNSEYYIYSSTGSVDFWNPNLDYNTGDIVMFKGQFFESVSNDNIHMPNSGYQFSETIGSEEIFKEHWVLKTELIDINPRWKLVELWDSTKNYINNDYVVFNKALYLYNNNNIDNKNEPNKNIVWDLKYDIMPNTDEKYGIGTQSKLESIIEMNNKYYLLVGNNESTLENGINIYINKIWKNILINIIINDNTIPNISSSDRDSMYSDLNKKLTASNFIKCINDLNNKYGFTDFINYIIIDRKNNEIKIEKYNQDNIENLPYMLFCETPEEIRIRLNSLSKNPIEMPNILKVKNQLSSNIISDFTMLNYYNSLPLAAEIKENEKTSILVKNYSGIVNNLYDVKYRFSGEYMPLFYDIELFDKSPNISGNYKFDTQLSKFGIMLERKFRKINRNGDILKLKNNNSFISIYPMIDEYYYTFSDFFIFKSTWDKNYYLETSSEFTPIVDIQTLQEEINIGEINKK
jgi:hypothetical protein